LTFVAACGAVLGGGRGDWNYFVELGRSMVQDTGLGVYARYGDGQTGPLTLLAAGGLSLTPRNGFVACAVLCAVAGLLAVRAAERPETDREPDDVGTCLLVGGVAVIMWWSMLGAYGHLDDAVVLACLLFAFRQHVADRSERAGVLVGLAVGFKPWAAVFWPLTLGRWWRRGHRLPGASDLGGAALAAGIGAASWMPFVIAHPSTLSRLSPTVKIAPDSVLELVGATQWGTSMWLRIGQLIAASAVALIAVVRRRPEGAVLAAIGCRLLLDPGTWPYYTPGFVLGALVWDLHRRHGRFPIVTLAAAVLLCPAWLLPWETGRAALRLCATVGAIAAVCIIGERSPAATGEQDGDELRARHRSRGLASP
jgi:Glycosyltransferase family 87